MRRGNVTPARDGTMAGIGLAVLAYSLFSVHDATTKWLVASLPVWQVLFVRSTIVVAGSLLIGGRPLVERSIITPAKGMLALRGALILVAWMAYFTAARTLPLAQLTTLYFSSPIMITAMAVPLLGERITAGRGGAVLIGFAGVLVAANPAGLSLSAAAGMTLFAALMWSFSGILTRRIARREPSMLQMFWSNLFFMVPTGLACLFSWHAPTLREAALLALIGLIGGVAQFCLFEAARRIPAAITGTLEYSALLWAFTLGWLIWGEMPPPSVFAGAALILSAGILLVLAERAALRRRAVQTSGL